MFPTLPDVRLGSRTVRRAESGKESYSSISIVGAGPPSGVGQRIDDDQNDGAVA
jgi:hypothetical protein